MLIECYVTMTLRSATKRVAFRRRTICPWLKACHILNAPGSTLNANINSNWNNKKSGAVGYIGGIPSLI